MATRSGRMTLRRVSLPKREALAGYLFIAPAVMGFMVFIAGPIVASLVFSLTEFRLIVSPRWAGLANYTSLVKDPLFWQSVNVTVRYAMAALPLGLVFSLGLAVLMNQKVKGIAFWRTVYYLPSVISGVAVAVLWAWILSPEFGLLNVLLRYVGIKGPHWLGNTRTALPALVLIGLWGVGGNMVIYLAGLQGIPTELYEAAEIDGAGSWRRFVHITLPMLSPIIFFNLVMGLIGVFQFFTEPFVMTRGGPENSTLTYMLYLYRNAFSYFKMGYASALAWVFFALVFLLTLAVFRSGSLWVYYEARGGR